MLTVGNQVIATMTIVSLDVVGAVIAGGASSRFGSPKAFARVGGERVVDRVVRALRAALGHDSVIAIVNDDRIAAEMGLPYRNDELEGNGALGGIHAALLVVRERGRDGILAVGCDMPFLEPALMQKILTFRGDYDVVLPESEGRRGVEPLCGWYATSCIPHIESAIARGDARMIGFHDDARVHRLPLSDVRTFGDPAVMFMNLNTEADRAAAERIATSS